MSPLSDAALDRLRAAVAEPELAGTRYDLVGVLGRGGMATVYRARDRALGRDVALKVLDLPELGAAEARLAARMRREARVLARLEHPGIVPVHDVGTLGDGRVFCAMKLVQGRRLDEVIGGLALPERLRLFLRVCEAVAFAHAAGIVHRDLKPQNVMLGPFGEVLVVDWGLAKPVIAAAAAEDEATDVDGDLPEAPAGDDPPAAWTQGDDLDAPRAAAPDAGAGAPPAASPDGGTLGGDTREGWVLGTPGYMAPEQAQGRALAADARSDVFALGALLHFALAGAPPADGEVRLPVGTPRPLAAICRRALELAPQGRYPGAAELAADVERFIDGQPVSVHRESLRERAGRLFLRYQTAVLLVVAYLLMRAVILLVARL